MGRRNRKAIANAAVGRRKFPNAPNPPSKQAAIQALGELLMPKVALQRTRSYRVVKVLERSSLLGCRVRPILSEDRKLFPTEDGYIMEVVPMLVLSGPLKGSTIDLKGFKLKALNSRKCHCPAYGFPHAPGLGECKTSAFEEQAPETISLESLFIPGKKEEK